MSRLVKNELFAGKTVQVSSESVTFDKDGIGEIQSDALAEEILTLKGYSDPVTIEVDADAVDQTGADGQQVPVGEGVENGEGAEGAENVEGTENADAIDGVENVETPVEQTAPPVEEAAPAPVQPVRQPAAKPPVHRQPPKSTK